MVPSELTRRVGYGGVIILLDCWKWGPYGVPDQQGDMVSLFDRTMFYLHTKFYMCFPDFWYDFPRVPAYLWARGKLFFFSPKFFYVTYIV